MPRLPLLDETRRGALRQDPHGKKARDPEGYQAYSGWRGCASTGVPLTSGMFSLVGSMMLSIIITLVGSARRYSLWRWNRLRRGYGLWRLHSLRSKLLWVRIKGRLRLWGPQVRVMRKSRRLLTGFTTIETRGGPGLFMLWGNWSHQLRVSQAPEASQSGKLRKSGSHFTIGQVELKLTSLGKRARSKKTTSDNSEREEKGEVSAFQSEVREEIPALWVSS